MRWEIGSWVIFIFKRCYHLRRKQDLGVILQAICVCWWTLETYMFFPWLGLAEKSFLNYSGDRNLLLPLNTSFFWSEEHELSGSSWFCEGAFAAYEIFHLNLDGSKLLYPSLRGHSRFRRGPDRKPDPTWVLILALLLISRWSLALTLISPGSWLFHLEKEGTRGGKFLGPFQQENSMRLFSLRKQIPGKPLSNNYC